jgi:hypothetical protein
MTKIIALLVSTAVAMILATDVFAGQYPGRGDTGWIEAGKRECCNEAIAFAQQDSMAVCRNVGGTPSPLRGGVQRRGYCEWQSAVDDYGVTFFRCVSEATVPCR